MSHEPQAIDNDCDGAAACWPQAGIPTFELSLTYLEALGAMMEWRGRVCNAVGPLDRRGCQTALLHLILPEPTGFFFLPKVCIPSGLNI